jgi:hypothetical protein
MQPLIVPQERNNAPLCLPSHNIPQRLPLGVARGVGCADFSKTDISMVHGRTLMEAQDQHKATPSGSLVSGQGSPPPPKIGCGWAGLAIMPLCMLTIVHSKPQSTNHRFLLTTVGACAIQIL